MATRQELAQAVRQAYPGQFDDVGDDNELAEAVLKAHPEFSKDLDPETPATPTDERLDPLEPLFGNKMGGMGKAGFMMSGLELGARAGRKINEGVQKAAGFVAEKGGEMGAGPLGALLAAPAAIASEVALPQNKVQMALLPGAFEGKATGLAKKGPTKINKPTKLQEGMGSMMSATSSVNQRYTNALAANPELLETAPSRGDIVKKYTEYFANQGKQINSETLKQYTRENFFPNEGQVSTISDIVETAISQIDLTDASKSKLTTEEAFIAASAARAALRSSAAGSNRSMAAYFKGAKEALDNYLEAQGQGELKELGRQYFQANVKEQFDSFLPRNKNQSPNALRSLIMGGLAGDALKELVAGNTGAALGRGVQAAAMSPLLLGQAVKGAAKAGVSRPGYDKAAALGLDNLFQKRDKKKGK